jgi:hypothetical protein
MDSVERTSSLVMETVLCLLLAENEMCDEYAYRKQFITVENMS